MKLIMGADIAGLALKEEVKKHLAEQGWEITDIGMTDEENMIPYYQVAATAAQAISSKQAERAMLFCGTGAGVSIVANKFPGVYSCVVESEFGGLHCKAINNCNVLTMGGWVVPAYQAKRIADTWLKAKFTEGYDEIADFLQNALPEIQAIEAKTMKPATNYKK